MARATLVRLHGEWARKRFVKRWKVLTRTNSKLETIGFENINARIEPGAEIREGAVIDENAVVMMGAIINIGAQLEKIQWLI